MQILLLVLVLVNFAGAALGAKEKKPDKSEIYLASRDEMWAVDRVIEKMPIAKGKTFVGIIGGQAFLNFLPALEPSQIELLDINGEQVEFGRCVVEMIKVNDSTEKFLSAYFSRPYVRKSEKSFFSNPSNPAILKKSIDQFPSETRDVCLDYFSPIASAKYNQKKAAFEILGNKVTTFVSLNAPTDKIKGQFGYMYLGLGWLKSEESYQATRNVLINAKISYSTSDIKDFMPKTFDADQIYVWATNLTTFYPPAPQAHDVFISRLHKRVYAEEKVSKIIYTSTYFPVRTSTFVPFSLKANGTHNDSGTKVRRHVEGKKVLEIVPDKNHFGDELKAQNTVRLASEPFKKEIYDTTILNILVGSGATWWRSDMLSEFEEILRESVKKSENLVILEHNPESKDFAGAKETLISIDEIIFKILNSVASLPMDMEIESSVGSSDNKRTTVIAVRLQPIKSRRKIWKL